MILTDPCSHFVDSPADLRRERYLDTTALNMDRISAKPGNIQSYTHFSHKLPTFVIQHIQAYRADDQNLAR